MRTASIVVFIGVLAPACRREAESLPLADAAEVGPDAGPEVDGSPADTGSLTDTLADVVLPDAWSGGPFAIGDWTLHTLDGGKCFMKLAHGATRDNRSLRWDSCGTGCRRSVADWAATGYRLATPLRAVEDGVLLWLQIYPRSTAPASPQYVVQIAQGLDDGSVRAAVGQETSTASTTYCTLHQHPKSPTGVLLLELTNTTLPIGAVQGDSLTLVRDVPLTAVLDGGVTGMGWSAWVAPGLLHVQTVGPPGLAVIPVPEGSVPTRAMRTPPIELPVAVAGGSIGGDYLTGVGSGVIWFVGNDARVAKLYEVPSPRELRWFDVDHKRADTIVWAEYDTSTTTYSLWESPLATVPGGAKPKKLHTQGTSYGSFVANAGAVGFFGETAGHVKVLRTSDGVLETLAVPPADRPLEMVWVDEKESWFTTEPSSTTVPGSGRSFIMRIAR